jgi:hypothetical protein
MTKPRRVDFFMHNEDYQCAYLGALGFSTKYIIRQTKLGAGQVTYRLKKAHIRRMDYRNGDSDFAAIVMQGLRPTLTRNLNSFLKNEAD